MGTTLFETSYPFKNREGRSFSEAWLLTWEQWMGAMAEAGRPMEFQHSLEMADGYNLTLGPGIFSMDFFK